MRRGADSAGASRGRLPAELTPFLGRREEIREIRRLVSTARLLTLTGVGGAGKTRLAARVAADLRRAFRDGTWWVDLAPVSDAAALELAVVESLGVVDQTDRPLSRVLAGYLRERDLLLVLDNCEHLVDACAGFVRWALREAAGLRVLCTSREPLRTEGEHIWPVPPLPVPDPAQPTSVERNGEFAAVALFAERAAAVATGFALSADNHREVIEVCRRLDGLPLAIELAAAQLRTHTIHQLVAALGDRFKVLTVRHAVPGHHQTLQATFDWSFALCSPREQALWTRLTVFHDSFDLDAARSVCADPQVPADTVLDLLSGLVEKSVLIRDQAGGDARYRLLETVRQYGLRPLSAPCTPREALRRRHRDWYLDLARRFDADWFGPRQLAWLRRIRGERGNLRAALRFSLSAPGDAAIALELATRLLHYWYASGQLHECRYWLEHALATSSEPTPARAEALAAFCHITLPQGDLTASRARAGELRQIAGLLGDPRLLALAHRADGMAALVGNDLTTAQAELDRALTLFAQVGEQSMTMAMAHLSRAMTALFQGDLETATTICDHNRAMCQAHGDQWWLSHAASTASHIAVQAGDLSRAADHTRQSLRLAGSMGNVLIVAVGVERFAWIAGGNGNQERAARLLGAADQLWQRLGRVMFGAAQWLRGHDTCVAAARAALGEVGYDAAFGRGAALTLEQAVAEALDRDRPGGRRRAAPPPPGPASVLTRREREVAGLVAEGLSNRQIAARLVMSPRTAEGHVENVLRKLGFTSRSQIATWIVRGQRPEPEDPPWRRDP